MLQSMTVHKSRLERAKEEAVSARKAEQAAKRVPASPALPRGNWGLSSVRPCVCVAC